MTTAICLYCGSVKIGAFVPCPDCGKIPEGEEDMVRSFVLTDHHFPDQQLQTIGETIKSGVKLDLQIDPATMQQMKAALKLLGVSEIVSRRRSDN